MNVDRSKFAFIVLTLITLIWPIAAYSETPPPFNPNQPVSPGQPINSYQPNNPNPTTNPNPTVQASFNPNQSAFQSAPITQSDLATLDYSLIGSFRSSELGMGNIADPEMGEIKGKLFLYFMNANDLQSGKTGNDNYIHSFSSTDRGKTWKLDSGIRIAQKSPLSVSPNPSGGLDAWIWNHSQEGEILERYVTSDGLRFSLVGSTKVDLNPCKNSKAESPFTLGDVQVVKLKDGSYKGWAFAVFKSDSQIPYFRIGCVLTSFNGTSDWVVTNLKDMVFDYDLGTNPETYRNSKGIIEQILPLAMYSNKAIRVIQMRTSVDDGKTWSALNGLSFAGNDPGRLDTSYGDKLLTFGNYDQRQGGVIIVAKQVKSTVKAAKKDEPTLQTWYITGAIKNEIKMMNLCTNEDLTKKAQFTITGKMIVVKNPESSNQMIGNCYYLLIGKQKLIA